jgi:hypothetical protein
MAVTKDCSGKTINSPTGRYNDITKLSYCGSGQAFNTYGEVTVGYTYKKQITRVDAVQQSTEFISECEDKFGKYSIQNGPTGTYANATVTCVVPKVITYSGSKSKGWSEDKKDCEAQNGEFDYNLTTASYCIIR